MGNQTDDQNGAEMAVVEQADPRVAKAQAGTLRRWNEECEKAKADIAEAEAVLELAGQEYQSERADQDDEFRADAYRRCMQALGRRDAYQRILTRLTDGVELPRRLEESAKLAKKFR